MNQTNQSIKYQILISGILDERWWSWYEELDICRTEDGNTVISGEMDQPALYGLLNRIRDTGTELISVEKILEKKSRTNHIEE